MEKKKIDRIIEAFRNHIKLKEEGVVSSSPTMSSGTGGFTSSSNPKGPVAGFDPVLGLRRRKGPQIKLPPGSRKRWMDK